MKKDRVGIFFGGRSAEHDVSIRSARSIYENIDRQLFEPELFYISRRGNWKRITPEILLNLPISTEDSNSFLPWETSELKPIPIDIYFPVLHGPFGEDGRFQSILEMANKPFVGAAGFASALAMDKIVSKILFQRAGLPVGDFLYFTQPNSAQIQEMVEKKFPYPVFVKPCSLGSSVGISKVNHSQELQEAVNIAFSYDQKIIIEKGINVREIEVAVMGNRDLVISKPGELIPHDEFYSYKDKYLLNKTKFHIPANISVSLEKEINTICKKAYRSLFLNGMARIDLFLEKESNSIFINEINTIPGFTEISMFPKLMAHKGISFTALITRLIELGIEYHRQLPSNIQSDEYSSH